MAGSVWRGARRIDYQAQEESCSSSQSGQSSGPRDLPSGSGQGIAALAGGFSRNPCHPWEDGWVALREVEKQRPSQGSKSQVRGVGVLIDSQGQISKVTGRGTRC